MVAGQPYPSWRIRHRRACEGKEGMKHQSTRHFITTGIALICVGLSSGDNRYLVIGACMIITPLVCHIIDMIVDFYP